MRIERPMHVGPLAALLALALGLRILGLERSLWLDEVFSIEMASGGGGVSLRDSDTPPLYFLLLRGWMSMGSSDAWLRSLSIVIGMLTLWVLISWVRRTDRVAALVSGLLFATNPMVLRYSQEVRSYGLLMLFVALSLERASRLVAGSSSGRDALWVGLFLALAVSTHLVGVFAIGAVLAYAILGSPREHLPASIRRWGPLVVFPPMAAFGFWHEVFLRGASKGGEWWMPALDLDLAGETAARVFGLREFREALLDAGLSPEVREAGAWWGVGAAALLVFAWSTRGLRELASASIYWAQLAAYSVLVRPVFIYRTALAGLVPFAAFLGLRSTLGSGARRSFAIGMITIVSAAFAWSWASNAAWRPYEDWRGVADLVEASSGKGTVVLVHPGYAAVALRHYLPPSTAGRVKPLMSFDAQPGRTPEAVILVLRIDANTRDDTLALGDVRRRLEQTIGSRTGEERFGGIVVSRFGREKSATTGLEEGANHPRERDAH